MRHKLLKAKYIALGMVWLASVTLLTAWSILWVEPSANLLLPDPSTCVPSQNHIGKFKLVHRNPEQNGKPSCVLSFDSLRTESGNLGMFKTSLQRTLRIDGLHIGVYEYQSGQSQIAEIFNHSASVKDAVKHSIKKFGCLFSDESSDTTNYDIRPKVDFQNLTKLIVRDFQFSQYEDDVLTLEIKSQTAQTIHGEAGLVLRGHVVIRGNDDVVLECNHVIWDISSQMFIARGIYALRQNGIVRAGKDIRLDMKLKKVIVSSNSSNTIKEYNYAAQNYTDTYTARHHGFNILCSNRK